MFKKYSYSRTNNSNDPLMVVFKDTRREVQWLGRTEGLLLDQGMTQYNSI